MNDAEFQELVKRARKREPEALAAIFEQFYPRILKYMRYRTTSDAAEDLAGEVFLRMMRHVHKQRGSFRAWLYRIAANVVTDHYRRRSLRRTEPLDDTAKAVPHPKDMPGAVHSRMDLEAGLKRLTDEQREFVVLKFIQGLTNGEIAEVTGRNPAALRALQFRALQALRTFLDGPEVRDDES